MFSGSKKHYSKDQCINDMENCADFILHGVIKESTMGLRKANEQLAKMERNYYLYRIANPKYDSMLGENSSTSTGTLDKFRSILKEIVLDASVPPEIKKKAVSILLAQHSNKALYDIARSDQSIAQPIERIDGKNVFVAPYIIQNFPANADQDLINLAFFWANKANDELTRLAISKITSPKSLFTLCLFFHDNHNNMQYIPYVIEQLGKIIDDNSKKLDKNGRRSDYINGDCDYEVNWLKVHEMSMLYSAHTALEKVIVVFADRNRITDNDHSYTEELALVQQAIDKMIVPSFLMRIIRTSSDADKVGRCKKRYNEIRKIANH